MVKRLLPICGVLALGITFASAFDLYTSAQQKIDLIAGGRLQAGARIDLSLGEINAWAGKEAPEGVRSVKLTVTGPDTVSASALVDFGKLRRAQGYEPGWLMSKLLDGERPVSAAAHLRSGGGRITVELNDVSISGLQIEGSTVEFLLRNFVQPFYPGAVVGEPVAMGFRIDRLQVAPSGVQVVIGR